MRRRISDSLVRCISEMTHKGLQGNAILGAVLLICALVASPSLATQVILDEDDRSVLQILDLAIPTFTELYNVEFVFTTAVLLYGEDLLFDLDEEDAALALIAINDALNEDNPATRAGPESTLPYAIAVDLTNEGPLAVLGGKYYPLGQQDGLGNVDPMTWDACRTPNCAPGGASLLDPNEYVTYASFTVVPEPGTALLMGLGLAGLFVGGSSRREESQGTA